MTEEQADDEGDAAPEEGAEDPRPATLQRADLDDEPAGDRSPGARPAGVAPATPHPASGGEHLEGGGVEHERRGTDRTGDLARP